MSEVHPNFKPDPAPCPCGCGVEGQPRAKAWADGLAAHARPCRCRRCTGSRVKRQAANRERRIARRLPGGERQPLSGQLSGADVASAVVDVEETADRRYRGLFSWWDGKGVQAKVARLLARRLRPRAFIVWDETRDPDDRRRRRGLAVMPVEDLYELCEAACGPEHDRGVR